MDVFVGYLIDFLDPIEYNRNEKRYVYYDLFVYVKVMTNI